MAKTCVWPSKDPPGPSAEKGHCLGDPQLNSPGVQPQGPLKCKETVTPRNMCGPKVETALGSNDQVTVMDATFYKMNSRHTKKSQEEDQAEWGLVPGGEGEEMDKGEFPESALL